MDTTDYAASLAAFASLVANGDRPMDLTEGAFAVAGVVHPQLDPGPYRRTLADWSGIARERLGGLEYPMQRVKALARFLFDELGLQGNRTDYYDPRNSCLNDVIDRRLGIPITLSVVTLIVGTGAGLPLEGVGFPGHFLVRYTGEEGSFVLFDPFDRGEILIEEDCKARLEATYGPQVTYDPKYLQRVSERQIVARMLLNLKGIYLHFRDYRMALGVVDRLLILDPGRYDERRDRGMLLLWLQHFDDAIEELETYLNLVPDALDAARVQGLIDEVRTLHGDD